MGQAGTSESLGVDGGRGVDGEAVGVPVATSPDVGSAVGGTISVSPNIRTRLHMLTTSTATTRVTPPIRNHGNA